MSGDGYLFQTCAAGKHDACEVAQGIAGDFCTCTCHDEMFAPALTDDELDAMEKVHANA